MSVPKALLYLRGYLRRPYLYKDLLRQPFRLLALQHPRERTDAEALAWCRERQQPLQTVLNWLIGDEAFVTAQIDAFEQQVGQHGADGPADQRASPVPTGGANMCLLFVLARWLAPRAVLETGVANGWSSWALLESFDTSKRQQKLISIDRPDMNLKNDRAIGNVVPQSLYPNWKLLLGVDRDCLPKALKLADGELDLAHYDSDKSYLGRAYAYEKIWQALTPGGIFVSDDINDNLAFAHFCQSKGVTPMVVAHGRQFVGIVIKPERSA